MSIFDSIDLDGFTDLFKNINLEDEIIKKASPRAEIDPTAAFDKARGTAQDIANPATGTISTTTKSIDPHGNEVTNVVKQGKEARQAFNQNQGMGVVDNTATEYVVPRNDSRLGLMERIKMETEKGNERKSVAANEGIGMFDNPDFDEDWLNKNMGPTSAYQEFDADTTGDGIGGMESTGFFDKQGNQIAEWEYNEINNPKGIKDEDEGYDQAWVDKTMGTNSMMGSNPGTEFEEFGSNDAVFDNKGREIAPEALTDEQIANQYKAVEIDPKAKAIVDGMAKGEIDPEEAKGWMDKIEDWYSDNPTIAKALTSFTANYITTGNPYSAAGKAIEAGAGAGAAIAKAKVEKDKTSAALVKDGFTGDSVKAFMVSGDPSDLKENFEKTDRTYNQDLNKLYVQAGINLSKEQRTELAKKTKEEKAAAVKVLGDFQTRSDKASQFWTDIPADDRMKYNSIMISGADVNTAMLSALSELGIDPSSPAAATMLPQLESATGQFFKNAKERLEGGGLPGDIKKASLKAFLQNKVLVSQAAANGLESSLVVNGNPVNQEKFVGLMNNIKLRSRNNGGAAQERRAWDSLVGAFNLSMKNPDTAKSIIEHSGKAGLTPFLFWASTYKKNAEAYK